MEPEATTSQNMSTSGEPMGFTILDGKFFRIIDDGINNITAVCVKCEPDLVKIRGQKNSTSNFISHLKRRHGNVALEEYQNYKRSKSSQFKQVLSKKYTSKQMSLAELDETVVKFVIDSLVPLRVVENRFFKSICEGCTVGPIMSRDQLGRKIDKLFKSHVEETKLKLKDSLFICTTADIWSSHKRSFFGVSAHWINVSDLKRESAALSCRRFKGVHSYDTVANVLNEIHSEYAIDRSKLLATVTDNGSNFVKAFQVFGVEREAIEIGADYGSDNDCEEELEQELLNSCNAAFPNHMRCSCHTLNLCASVDFRRVLKSHNDLLEVHQRVMNKCNKLWRALKPPQSTEIVKNTLGHTLNRPDETRWNSLYESLVQIYKAKENMALLWRELNIKDCLKDQDFDYINEYILCTKPLTTAIDILQSEDSIYYGILIPCILTLRHKLEILNNNSWKYCKPIVSGLLKSVTTRFSELLSFRGKISEDAVIAALTYPKFKNKWFCLVNPNIQQSLLNLLKNEIATINSSIENRDEQGMSVDNKDTFFDFLSSTTDILSPNDDVEVLDFLADKDTTIQCLSKYPAIKQTFIKFNTPLPSSALVERLFPYATMVNLPRSHMLSDDLFEKRFVLKSHIDKIH